MSQLTPRPALTLAEATAALDFVRPLRSGDPRWRDLSPARGGDVTKIEMDAHAIEMEDLLLVLARRRDRMRDYEIDEFKRAKDQREEDEARVVRG